MNTPTHALLGLGLFGSRASRGEAIALVVGGVLPDVPMFVLYLWGRFIAQLPESTLWQTTYFEPAWQHAVDAGHSVPLALGLFAVARWQRGRNRTASRGWRRLELGAAAALLHSAFDFPVHHNDGHRHFWPLSSFRFDSPISYWDPCCFGPQVSAIETLAMAALSVVLFRRAHSRFARGAFALLAVAYVSGFALVMRASLTFPWLATLLGGSPR